VLGATAPQGDFDNVRMQQSSSAAPIPTPTLGIPGFLLLAAGLPALGALLMLRPAFHRAGR
jgi:hypothetical protein